MKTPLDDLEVELRQLLPRRPSELLALRVEQAIAAERGAQLRRRWIAGLAAAAVVALALLPLLHKPGGSPGQLAVAPAVGLPLRSEDLRQPKRISPTHETRSADAAWEGLTRLAGANYLYGAADDGIVFASSTTPFRKIRYQYLDTTDWRDEEAQAVIRVVVPREDVVLVPLNVY